MPDASILTLQLQLVLLALHHLAAKCVPADLKGFCGHKLIRNNYVKWVLVKWEGCALLQVTE